jgi:hypothetical protein
VAPSTIRSTCIRGIALEPGPGRAEPEGVTPGVHVGHDLLAADAGQGVAEQDLQITRRIFLGLRIRGIRVNPCASLRLGNDQMTGLVQQRMHRRVGACVDGFADDAGFRLAPVTAGNRCAVGDADQHQAVTREQGRGVIAVDVGKSKQD